MRKLGGNLARKYKAAPRAQQRTGDIPQERLYQEIERGLAFFWGKRGGRPAGASSFGERSTFGKGVGA